MLMNPYPADPSQQPQQQPPQQNTIGPAATMAPSNPLSYQQAMAQALQSSGQASSGAPNLSGVMQMMQMMNQNKQQPGPNIYGSAGDVTTSNPFTQTGSLT